MRHDDLIASVNQFLTAPPYEACLLLVHPHPVDLHDAMLRLEAAFHWPGWPAGQELAAVLLDVAPQLADLDRQVVRSGPVGVAARGALG